MAMSHDIEVWRGYPVRLERVQVGRREYATLVPANSEALLDDPRTAERFSADGYLPYWAALWPGALLLADVVAQWGPPQSEAAAPTVLELGAGLGLVGIVAAELGYRVTVSDYDEDALAFARENARRNHVELMTRHVDWRQTYTDLAVERILAADVLYEARNLEPIARFIRQHLSPDGFALVGDADRSTADPFAQIAESCGLTVENISVERRVEGSVRPLVGRIFRLTHAQAGSMLG